MYASNDMTLMKRTSSMLSNVSLPELKLGKVTSYYGGSDSFKAPELNEKLPYFGSQVDLYSAGILLFCMRSGTCPFIRCGKVDETFKLFTKKP